ncbi:MULTISPECIES: ATP-grasp domain-containing protein [unclassified Klebsiella]|uniref:ATP-grasp domain-containing protein n=1 Tax=unclassified Klebsiella TaxID=2608929 RepID=UPI0022A3717A|nr:ATP-grasp domain-containing protein [Klebsiella aerogenes]HCU2332774.1 ATP-grasp domain-containing protein [Klebsiella aerogenes]
MERKIWIMEGLASQRDIIFGINDFTINNNKHPITTYASHSQSRHEILSTAHFSLSEPTDINSRMSFISSITKEYGISAIQVGKACRWYEQHRRQIEALGVSLTTGASQVSTFDIADDKVSFAKAMQAYGLPVVPSIRITDTNTLEYLLKASPFPGCRLCVKPVTGIYGMGFWLFDEHALSTDIINHPEQRRIQPEQYLAAVKSSEVFTPLTLMPWLPGPEYSVDMLLSHGKVLTAIGRRKEGALQYLENSGPAIELACACAEALHADGLVNVQTRNDTEGKPLLLEINLRPSGGIGYTRHSGVNLPGLFAAQRLDLLTADDIIRRVAHQFTPATIRVMTESRRYPQQLNNVLAPSYNAEVK